MASKRNPRRPRVAIVSRIFTPEPAAASFRLESLARTFAADGADVRVMTVTPPADLAVPADSTPPADLVQSADSSASRLKVSRWPVLRNSEGYVRGYLQYLSFDIPMFCRVLLARRPDVIICEPPPTSVFLAALAARLRRIPLVAYAPDVWSDATAGTGAPGLVTRAVRLLEGIGWRLAAGVVAVNEGVAERVRAIAPSARVEVVGNGVDANVFAPSGEPSEPGLLVYTGTVSEWQGAETFVRAAAELADQFPELRLVFIGQGTAWQSLQQLTAELGAPVEFVDQVPAAEAARWLRRAAASVASIRPGFQYDFAYPTKIFASWAAGTPVIYAGPGPARAALAEHPELGEGVDYDLAAVRAAMSAQLAAPATPARSAQIRAWAEENVSLDGVSRRVVAAVKSWSRRPGPVSPGSE